MSDLVQQLKENDLVQQLKELNQQRVVAEAFSIEKTKEFKETYKGLTPKNIRIETLESIFYQGKNFSVKLYDKKKELKNHKININHHN